MNTSNSLAQYYHNMSCISLHGELGDEPAQLIEPGDTAKVLCITASVIGALLLLTSFS